jgi:WhiB family redox-sensing transcriptional regulator
VMRPGSGRSVGDRDDRQAPTDPIPPCLGDPDRWAAGGEDPELKALCRACARRWLCAKEALKTPGAEGMWSGVHIPKDGRGRTFALRQLRSLAAHGGYDAADSG